MDTVGRLIQLLDEHDTSVYRLSRDFDISYSTLASTMKRGGGQLSIDTIERICEALGIKTYEFFMTDDDWEDLDRYCEAKVNRLLRQRNDLSTGA